MRKQNSMRRFKFQTLASIFFLSMFCLSSEKASAAPALGDYDADGRSDLAVAEVNRGSATTTWFVRLTGDAGANPLGFTFPAAADAFVTGKYYRNNPKLYPGIVRVKDANSPLEWMIKTPSNTNTVLSYGVPGDVIPNQGDLDCDGITDFVVTRNGRAGFFEGFKLWYVALSSSPGQVQQLLFGLSTDQVATADFDGDGCSELIALRGDYTWYSRKLFSDTVTSVQWGLPGDIPLVPQDLTGDGLADYVVTRNFGDVQYALLRLSNGTAALEKLGTKTAVPLIGNFIGLPFYGWLERATSFMGILQGDRSVSVFPFSLPTNWLIRPDGTAVSPLVAPPTVTPPTTSSSNVTCDDQIKIKDGSGGFKYNGNNSRHTIKPILPSYFSGHIRKVEALSKGKVIDELYQGFPNEWGNRERYYGNDDVNSYPGNLLIRLTLDNGKTACATIPDPTQNYD